MILPQVTNLLPEIKEEAWSCRAWRVVYPFLLLAPLYIAAAFFVYWGYETMFVSPITLVSYQLDNPVVVPGGDVTISAKTYRNLSCVLTRSRYLVDINGRQSLMNSDTFVVKASPDLSSSITHNHIPNDTPLGEYSLRTQVYYNCTPLDYFIPHYQQFEVGTISVVAKVEGPQVPQVHPVGDTNPNRLMPVASVPPPKEGVLGP